MPWHYLVPGLCHTRKEIMSEIKDPAAGVAVEAGDISADDETLDWDTKRFGKMIDHVSDEEPETVVAGSGDEEGDD